MPGNYTDEEIIAAIQKGGHKLEQVMKQLYQNKAFFRPVELYIKQMLGSVQDAEDIFQDGIVHLIMNIRKGKYKGNSNLKTYFTGICKNLWLQKYRQTVNRNRILQNNISSVQRASDKSVMDILLFKEKSTLIKHMLEDLGKACKSVLEMWSGGFAMKEIAQKVGYSSEGVARKKKHQCLKQLLASSRIKRDLLKDLSNE